MASFVVTSALVDGFVTADSVTDHPLWSGTLTSLAAVDGFIQLAGDTLWDAMPGNIDDWDRVDSLGGIQPTGTYLSDNVIDVGSAQTIRLVPDMRVLSFETGDLWDSRAGSIDEWDSIDAGTVEDAMVRLYVRITSDDPTGAPSWGPWHPLPGPAEYLAWGVQHKIEFTSGDPTHNIRVEELSLTAQTPA
jgi:hypothetical protein